MPTQEDAYIDERGRTRWRQNDALAGKLAELHDFLVVGGYPETHAARYRQLARFISHHPERIDQIHAQGRLAAISGIGASVAVIIGEYLDTGTSTKFQEFAETTPPSVLELLLVPGIGVKTARSLYGDHGLESLAQLKSALEDGRLRGVKGMGPKTLEAIKGTTAPP
jgi:DNA polymerase (family 10)